jgi:hypothetical protein
MSNGVKIIKIQWNQEHTPNIPVNFGKHKKAGVSPYHLMTETVQFPKYDFN